MLHQRMEVLISAAGETMGELIGEKEEPRGCTRHRDGRTKSGNFHFDFKIETGRLVGKIRQALKRMDEGEYGVCVTCGEDISERRLMARPVATHCIDCKTQAEQMERRGSRWIDKRPYARIAVARPDAWMSHVLHTTGAHGYIGSGSRGFGSAGEAGW